MTKNESTQPQLPPRSEDEYISRAEKFLADASKMDNAPVIWMVAAAFKNEDRAQRAEAENESLKAQIKRDDEWWEKECKRIGVDGLVADAEGDPFYLRNTRAEKSEAERVKLLEVVREYRESHICIGQRIATDTRCPTCIKADSLLPKEPKEEA